MSNVAAPRPAASAHQQRHAVPVVVCTQCHAIGLPNVVTPGSVLTGLLLLFIGLVPGLLYLLWRQIASGIFCRSCGAKGTTVPAESPRAHAILGPDADRVIHAARMEAARLLAQEEAARREFNRRQTRIAVPLLIVVLAGTSYGAWWLWRELVGVTPREPTVEERAERERLDAIAHEAWRAGRAAEAARAAEQERTRPPQSGDTVQITAAGVAYARPSAKSEPVLRLDNGDTYRIAATREGWYQLAHASSLVEAWVPADQVARVLEE